MNKLSGAGEPRESPKLVFEIFAELAPHYSLLQVLVPGLVVQKLTGARSRTRKVSRASIRCSQAVHAEQQLFVSNAVPRAEHAHHKTKEHAAEETCGSGSEEDHSDSDDEGIDGYKKGETVFCCLGH